MSVQPSTLWDYGNPELSEQRFRAALASASTNDALILRTQIARTFGLRRNFAEAQAILFEITSQLETTSPEVQVRYYLELGRTFVSATHPPETQTTAALEQARSNYTKAFQLAEQAQLDALAIDTLHMLAFVDSDPEGQIKWNSQAIAYMEASTQAEAKRWAGALYNNLGYALHQLGRYDEALSAFQQALKAHEQTGNSGNIRVAHWMIAWTLRAMHRLNDALEIQLRLEKECDEAGEPDSYVFEELELLYQALNNPERAEFYAARRAKLP